MAEPCWTRKGSFFYFPLSFKDMGLSVAPDFKERGEKKGKKNLTHESKGLLLAFFSHPIDHIQAQKNSSTLKSNCIKLSPRSTDLLLRDRCRLPHTSSCWLFISTGLCWDRSGTAEGSWNLSFAPAARLSCNNSHLSKPTGCKQGLLRSPGISSAPLEVTALPPSPAPLSLQGQVKTQAAHSSFSLRLTSFSFILKCKALSCRLQLWVALPLCKTLLELLGSYCSLSSLEPAAVCSHHSSGL